MIQVAKRSEARRSRPEPAKVRIAVVVGVLLVSTLGSARADSERDRRAQMGDRTGLTFGASIGRGRIAIECRICSNVDPIEDALSASLHAGFMLHPRLALLAEHWLIQYNDRGSDWYPDSQDHAVGQHLQTIALQLWPLKTVYLRAGVGVGWHRSTSMYAKVDQYPPQVTAAGEAVVDDDHAGRVTPAATFGIGWEFAHTRAFAADVQFRVGTTHRPADEYQVHNLGLNFGVAWY
jgi:hypothetical protein